MKFNFNVDDEHVVIEIPLREGFSFYRARKESVNYKKLMRFLKFKDSDIAEALGIKTEFSEFKKIELRKAKIFLDDICALLHIALVLTEDKYNTYLWFIQENPYFDNISPRKMLLRGRFNELARALMKALSSYKSYGENVTALFYKVLK